MKKKIAIIGGGASGLTSAIIAGRKGASVTLFERADRVGKKILVTGNGRCNLSNENLLSEAYNRSDFVMPVLEKFDLAWTKEFFRSLGVLTVSDSEGRIYPRTKEASTVLNALRRECEKLGVSTVLGREIREVTPIKDGFKISGERFDSVIVATGGGVFDIARNLGHTVTAVKPSLTALLTDKKYLKGLNGKRVDAVVTLTDGEKSWSERGEVLFRENGLSGIAVFNHSARINRSGKGFKIVLDVVPEMTEDELDREIESRDLTLGTDSLDGIVNRFMAANVLRETERARERSKAISRLLKGMPFEVIGLRKEGAQVTSGGVDASEVNEKLESKKCKGLYFCGEVLDVDGLCGGYNLQWAWSSGAAAGEDACRD